MKTESRLQCKKYEKGFIRQIVKLHLWSCVNMTLTWKSMSGSEICPTTFNDSLSYRIKEIKMSNGVGVIGRLLRGISS